MGPWSYIADVCQKYFWGELNSTILGGVINQRLGLEVSIISRNGGQYSADEMHGGARIDATYTGPAGATTLEVVGLKSVAEHALTPLMLGEDNGGGDVSFEMLARVSTDGTYTCPASARAVEVARLKCGRERTDTYHLLYAGPARAAAMEVYA